MSNWMADLYELQHYHALVKEANEYRLALKRFEGKPRKQDMVHRVMEWLQLSLLPRGSSLMERVSKDSIIKILAAKPNEIE